MISWLPNLPNNPLAIQSLQSSGVLARACGGMWPCSLELLSGVEAAQCTSLLLDPSFLQRVSELTFRLSPDLPPHIACEF